MNWKITIFLLLSSIFGYGQEINVRVGNTNYLTGTSTYTFAAAVPSGNSSSAITFTIQNTAASTVLNLTGTPKIAVGGPDQTMFTVNETATASSINGVGNTTFTVTFSPTSTGLKEATLTIENDDANESNYVINLKANAAPSKGSALLTTPSYVYPSFIPYINYQTTDISNSGNDIEVGSFTISDGNGTNDTDNLPTTLTNITFALSNSANIRSVALYDGATEVGEDVAGAASITFNNLSLVAPDNGTKTFTIRVSYNNVVTDGAIPVFTVTAATALASGSTFTYGHAGTASASTSRAKTSSISPDNRIDVVATKLEFTQEPSNTDTFVVMSPSVKVQAVDLFGNRDTGYTAIPVILTTTGSFNTLGTPVNAPNRNTSSGVATFASIVHSLSGTGFTLTATSGSLEPAVSTQFDISSASGASNYFRSRVSGDWSDPNTWETSHNNIDTWIVSTIAPTQVSRGIEILPGHTVTCTTTVVADQITIDLGAALTIEEGADFTLNNGSSDLTVFGTFNYNNGIYNQAAGARASFRATGVYNHTIASPNLTLPYAVWNATSICNVTGLNNVVPIVPTNINQSFGILNWNNPNQGAPVIVNDDAFKVAGVLNIGTTTANTNNIICLNDSGTHTNSIKTLNLNGGKLIASSGTGSNTLTLTGVATIDGGELIASQGSGIVAINALYNFNISSGKLILIDDANSGDVNFTLAISRNFTLSGTGALLLENVSSASGVANVTLNSNFTSTSTANPAVDFGTGAVADNAINVGRNFSKTEDGTFTTSSPTPAKGFVFFYNGTQTFTYTGTNSSSVNYTVNPGSTLSMASDLTFGSAAGPESIFTVLNGGRINLGSKVITGNATHSRMVFEPGSTLSTSNIGGIGGVGGVGSFQGFANVDTTPATGRLSLPSDVHYIFGGPTTTPFPIGAGIAFGNPATVLTLVSVTSNMTTPLTVNEAFTVLGGTFKLNPSLPAGNNLILNNAVLTVAGIFDNNGENQVLSGGGNPSVIVNGKFITRSADGFAATSAAAIPTIPTTLGSSSTVEYGRAGAQLVQGNLAYANLILSGGNTKTLLDNTAVSSKITIASPTLFDAQTFTAGGASTALAMTGTSQYRISGTGVKPDAAGIYTLASTSKIEFYGTDPIEIRLGSPAISYGKIDINGTNIANNSATTGIQFVSTASVFTVKNGATFKFKNTDGFTGNTSTALSNSVLVNPILEAASTVEYAGADQTITAYNSSTDNSYKKVVVSGTGTKTLATDPIFIRDNLTVTSSLLKIEGNKSLTVTNGITTVDTTPTEGISIDNNGSLVQVTPVDNELTNNNIGMINMQRTTQAMYRYDFTYWGSPVKNHTLKELSPMTLFDKYMSWDADTGAWVIINVGAEAMAPGKGYAVRAPQTFSTNPNEKTPYDGHFIGVPNNGDVTYATHGNGNSTPEKFNLLGNPYPSAIDIEKFLLANSTELEGTIYLWTHNTALDGYSYNNSDYAVYNFSGPTSIYPIGSTGGATKYLAAGQGFYVKGISAGESTVTFTNLMRETNNNNSFFRPAAESTASNPAETAEKHRVWLNLRNNEDAFNQTLVGYIENATDGIDWGYDGEQFGGNELKFYSVLNAKSFTIQGKALPFTDADEVPLGYKTTIAGNLTISIDHYDGLFDYQDIYVEDKLLNIIHDLKASNYEFTTAIGTFDDRFVLRYVPSETLGNPGHENIANGVMVYKNNHQITVKSQLETLQSITVYDLLGREVFNAQNIGSNSFNITDVVLNNQPLIVKAILVNGQVVTKKIIY